MVEPFFEEGKFDIELQIIENSGGKLQSAAFVWRSPKDAVRCVGISKSRRFGRDGNFGQYDGARHRVGSGFDAGGMRLATP